MTEDFKSRRIGHALQPEEKQELVFLALAAYIRKHDPELYEQIKQYWKNKDG
jgi:hypothetical protein